MEFNENPSPILRLNKLVFDEITFKRLGIESESELKVEIESKIAFNEEDEENFKVVLTAHGKKEDEYLFTISLIGFFSYEGDLAIPEDIRLEIISQNTVAILMPYLRSEISLLTAQPGVKCVVLPPVNINAMLQPKKDN